MHTKPRLESPHDIRKCIAKQKWDIFICDFQRVHYTKSDKFYEARLINAIMQVNTFILRTLKVPLKSHSPRCKILTVW